MIYLYFAVGVGFYIGLCLKSLGSFTEADSASILRGLLLGVIFWPIGMIVQVILALEKLK